MTGSVIGVLVALGVTTLAILAGLVTDRVLTYRDVRELDGGLPGHTPGRVRASRRARRRLHRDLVLLLVAAADRDDADAS